MIEAFPDVFVFAGTQRMAPGVTIGKTMTVVRTRGGAEPELTVLNSARLDDAGERALRSLGRVKHLVRLGAGHGLDDGWFIERFQPATWAPPRVSARPHGRAQNVVTEGGALPIEGRAFVFGGGKNDEAALVLPNAAGPILVTCDALQAHADKQGMSFLGALPMTMMGFFAHPVVVGPFWLKRHGVDALRADFARLVATGVGLDFTHMIAGHGAPLRDHAGVEVRAAVQRTFG